MNTYARSPQEETCTYVQQPCTPNININLLNQQVSLIPWPLNCCIYLTYITVKTYSQARCSGVCPHLSRAVKSAWALIRHLTTSRCPCLYSKTYNVMWLMIKNCIWHNEAQYKTVSMLGSYASILVLYPQYYALETQ